MEIPRDDPSEDKKAQGYAGFTRYACKMATSSGKTTVMGMLAAWSILNKVHNRGDGRFPDVVFIVCPNITIRDRLQELDPKRGEASLYRTRDLVPPHLMSKLNEGLVVVTNWHVLEPQQGNQVGGVGAAVVKRGEESDTALVARVLVRKALLAGSVTPETYGRAFGFERMMDTLGAIVGPATALLPKHRNFSSAERCAILMRQATMTA